MPDAHKNFAVSLVATAPSPAASGTSLVVTGGQGTRFPATPFNATIGPASTLLTPANSEIVRVTTVSTDTFTITRAQEGSSARTVVIGDQIAATITALTLTDAESSPAFATNAVVLGSAAAAGGAATVMRSNDTIAAFDATNPTTQAFGDTAVVGTAAFAARRDHKHALSMGFATTLPGSPVNGQMAVLTDNTSTPTYRWLFIYNSSSASSYKWEFVGGSPLTAAVATEQSTSSTTLADLATVGPSITIPNAGDYFIQWGGSARNGNAWNTIIEPVNGTGTTTIEANSLLAEVNVAGGSTTNFAGMTMAGTTLGRAASDIIRLKYRVGGNTSNIKNRWLVVIPMRVS